MAPTATQSLGACLHKSAYSPAKMSFFKIPFYYFTEYQLLAITDSKQICSSWNCLDSIPSSTSKTETCFKKHRASSDCTTTRGKHMIEEEKCEVPEQKWGCQRDIIQFLNWKKDSMHRHRRRRGGSSPSENALVIVLACTKCTRNKTCFWQQGTESIRCFLNISTISRLEAG